MRAVLRFRGDGVMRCVVVVVVVVLEPDEVGFVDEVVVGGPLEGVSRVGRVCVGRGSFLVDCVVLDDDAVDAFLDGVEDVGDAVDLPVGAEREGGVDERLLRGRDGRRAREVREVEWEVQRVGVGPLDLVLAAAVVVGDRDAGPGAVVVRVALHLVDARDGREVP